MDNGWLNKEIAALKINFRNGDNWAAPTDSQLQALGSLIGQGLSDHRRALRIEILREVTGISKISSSKELTLGTASELITYLKAESKEDWDLNDKGKKFLKEAEARCVERLPAKKDRKCSVEKRSTKEKEEEEIWIGGSAPGFGDEIEAQGESGLKTRFFPHLILAQPEKKSTQEQVDDRQGESYADRVERILCNMREAGYQPRYARSVADPW